jgi:hypothetical protein
LNRLLNADTACVIPATASESNPGTQNGPLKWPPSLSDPESKSTYNYRYPAFT